MLLVMILDSARKSSISTWPIIIRLAYHPMSATDASGRERRSTMKSVKADLQLKKAMITQPKREAVRRIMPTSQLVSAPSLLEAQVKVESPQPKRPVVKHQSPILVTSIIPKQEKSTLMAELDWDLDLEYDPMLPSDYDKISRERRERRGMEIEIEEEERKRRAREERDTKPSRERSSVPPASTSGSTTGFSKRVNNDEEDDELPMMGKKFASSGGGASGGVAIAPPPSLQDSPSSSSSSSAINPAAGGAGALGVAAKIMAKYGFREGQGLGRQQQGIAAALQVEKTSKRGGRIINDKDPIMPAPPPPTSNSPAPPKVEPTIAEIMKNPSKVIYLRNMVGPGEVDADLEPETRDECQAKYGDVNKVVIFEVPNVADDEAVRIFVEFKRMEAAIKAVIDLNGRFFGGRQVKAGFYNVERFLNMELND
uniref:Splicing factor 45 n=1 Tax=Alona affinis TaxID=381656 RepID=A0A9N6WR91_9CRUS|nr:EOG090X0BIL [Alona affinis]